MKTLLLILSFILLPWMSLAQGKIFDNSDQYKSYVIEETKFEESKIIILDNEKVDLLMDYVVQNEMYTFYGIVNKSKVAIASQLSIKSCWGQFLDLCQKIDDEKSGLVLQDVTNIPYLKDINFNQDKKTIIFIYSFKLGKSRIKNYVKPIMDEISKDPNFDYIVLSFDIVNIKM